MNTTTFATASPNAIAAARWTVAIAGDAGIVVAPASARLDSTSRSTMP
jgi:hypothetical protein